MFDKITIEYDGQKTEYSVRRIPHIERAKMYDALNGGRTSPNALEAMATYQVKVIARSLVDEDGKQLYLATVPADESVWGDESQIRKHPQLWNPEKLAAYATVLDNYQNPRVKDVAKNSSATPTENISSESH